MGKLQESQNTLVTSMQASNEALMKAQMAKLGAK